MFSLRKANRDCVGGKKRDEKDISMFPTGENREGNNPDPEFVRIVGQSPGIAEV
jgi:hypothetical protein